MSTKLSLESLTRFSSCRESGGDGVVSECCCAVAMKPRSAMLDFEAAPVDASVAWSRRQDRRDRTRERLCLLSSARLDVALLLAFT